MTPERSRLRPLQAWYKTEQALWERLRAQGSVDTKKDSAQLWGVYSQRNVLQLLWLTVTYSAPSVHVNVFSYSSGGQKSEMISQAIQGVRGRAGSFWRLGARIRFHAFFSFWWRLHPSATDSFLHLQRTSLQPLLLLSRLLSLTWTLLLHSYKDPCDDIGPLG